MFRGGTAAVPQFTRQEMGGAGMTCRGMKRRRAAEVPQHTEPEARGEGKAEAVPLPTPSHGEVTAAGALFTRQIKIKT